MLEGRSSVRVWGWYVPVEVTDERMRSGSGTVLTVRVRLVAIGLDAGSCMQVQRGTEDGEEAVVGVGGDEQAALAVDAGDDGGCQGGDSAGISGE